MTEIDERREELMRFHASDLRALARLKQYHRMLEINDLLKRQQEEMRMLLERQNEEGEDA